MGKAIEEKRSKNRICTEPRDMGHLLEAVINGKNYQFKVLNICHGGIGMLVKASEAELFDTIKISSQMEMNYINPKGTLGIKVEIRHITIFTTDPYKGDYCVGFSMSI